MLRRKYKIIFKKYIMKKVVFLIPPSEGKNTWWTGECESLSFPFKKPEKIAKNASQKDLKCSGKRYEEGIALNKECVALRSNWYIKAIDRYTGVMFNAIWYENMSPPGKQFFESNFLILSGMYGLLRPQDCIWNYKLPIESKWLLKFWGTAITDELNSMKLDYVINLLPLSYQKMIDFSALEASTINVDFLSEKNWEVKKMTHWVKGVKWKWIKKICEEQISKYEEFWWEIETTQQEIRVKILEN